MFALTACLSTEHLPERQLKLPWSPRSLPLRCLFARRQFPAQASCQRNKTEQKRKNDKNKTGPHAVTRGSLQTVKLSPFVMCVSATNSNKLDTVGIHTTAAAGFASLKPLPALHGPKANL